MWGRFRRGGGIMGEECASSPTVISETLLDFKYDQKIVLSLKSKFLWMACQAGRQQCLKNCQAVTGRAICLTKICTMCTKATITKVFNFLVNVAKIFGTAMFIYCSCVHKTASEAIHHFFPQIFW